MVQLTNKLMEQHYNRVVREKYNNDYEFQRWHLTPAVRSDYYMTARAITAHLPENPITRCLEIGPGPGTWTRFLWRHSPSGIFDLVDISKEMLRQFTLEMRTQPTATYHVSDFMKFAPTEPYDFIFSSRTLEYFEDQPAAISKIYSHLSDYGAGMIISGNPKLAMSGRDTRVQHSGQYSAKHLTTLLTKAGFTNIQTYPAIIRLHVRTPWHDFRALQISERIQQRWLRTPLASSRIRWCESYLTTFQK